MAPSYRFPWCIPFLLVACLCEAPVVFGQPPGKQKEPDRAVELPTPRVVPPPSLALLNGPASPIDLSNALRLAGVQNPEILLARSRVEEAVALRQLAAVQILPTINAGTNFNNHDGNLQQSNGQIIQVNRGSMYFGLGANAVGAGTVNIPGLVLAGNVSDGIFSFLVSRQVVRQREFANEAIRNDVLLRVAEAYLEVVRAQGRQAVAVKNRAEIKEVARITAAFAQTGQGRQADADRARTELEQRDTDLLQAEGEMMTASARLAQLLDLDPSTRLLATDGWVVPVPIVPNPVPLQELITIAVLQRPELKERQAAIRAALLELHGAKILPFSPNYVLGYSAGTFGGGSNLASEPPTNQARFDNFAARQDVDVIVYWSLRNLGLGNLALIRAAESRTRVANFRQTEVLDRVRAEVAAAYARVQARFAQIETNERAVLSSQRAYQQDFVRTKNREGLPIEVLDSLRLLTRSRFGYLDAIVDYNRAQFELYVALGQPPANELARPIPVSMVPPPGPPQQ